MEIWANNSMPADFKKEGGWAYPCDANRVYSKRKYFEVPEQISKDKRDYIRVDMEPLNPLIANANHDCFWYDSKEDLTFWQIIKEWLSDLFNR